MLFSSTTSNTFTGEVGTVASTIFSDFYPFIILIVGIVVGFFVLELFVGIFSRKNDTEKV